MRLRGIRAGILKNQKSGVVGFLLEQRNYNKQNSNTSELPPLLLEPVAITRRKSAWWGFVLNEQRKTTIFVEGVALGKAKISFF